MGKMKMTMNISQERLLRKCARLSPFVRFIALQTPNLLREAVGCSLGEAIITGFQVWPFGTDINTLTFRRSQTIHCMPW